MSTLSGEKAAQEKRITECSQRLAEELSARERGVAEKRQTEDTLVVKENLTDQIKQLSVRSTVM